MSSQTGLSPAPLTATRADMADWTVLTLRSNNLELAVVPELGAKVIALKNPHTGREWMSFPGVWPELFRNQPGDDFSRSPVAGWDECLPTVAPCEWTGRPLPDHGEVWSAPWELDADAWKQERITTSIRLRISPFHFTRTIAILDNAITVDYRLSNLSDTPQEFLWAMHPLLALRRGDQLELPEEAQPLLETEPWLTSLNFDEHAAKCAKVFVGPLRQGRVAVFNPFSGDRLTFEWDARVCNTLGIWLTRGGWNGHHHLALEPTNGAADSLAEAATQAGRCGFVSAHAEINWSVQIRVEP